MTPRIDAPDKEANMMMRQEFATFFAEPAKAIGKAKGGKRGRKRVGKRRKAA